MIELDKIYNEDCLIGMQNIPDNYIDCIICDLPYGTTRNEWDEIIPLDKLWEQYKRISKPTTPIILFSGQPFTSFLIVSNPKLFKYEIIWEKNRPTGFLNANRSPLRTHENILVFYDKPPIYNPQGLRYKPKKVSRSKTGENYGDTRYNEYINEFENYPTDIIRFNSENGRILHPTQKPVDLIGYLILTYTNESNIILDNCIGSGTTAIACHKLNRRFIGFEKDEKYYNIAVKRIKEEQRQLKLF